MQNTNSIEKKPTFIIYVAKSNSQFSNLLCQQHQHNMTIPYLTSRTPQPLGFPPPFWAVLSLTPLLFCPSLSLAPCFLLEADQLVTTSLTGCSRCPRTQYAPLGPGPRPSRSVLQPGTWGPSLPNVLQEMCTPRPL